MAAEPLPESDRGVLLPTPERSGAAFSFPYAQPYSIQLDLMTALFEAIEERKVAVFESPTGTGKSLSLICATFTWLRANAQRTAAQWQDDELEQDKAASEDGQALSTKEPREPAWVLKQAAERRKKDAMRAEEDLKERIAMVRRKEAELRKRAKEEAARQGASSFVHKKQRTAMADGGDDKDDSDEGGDDAFLPSTLGSSGHGDEDSNLTPAVRALMAQFSSGGGRNSEVDELPETMPKVIYVSRTHSQLSQFVAELKKTAFGKDHATEETQGPARVIPLGSRKQMCINEKVQKVGAKSGAEAMNEACKDAVSSKKQRCKFLPPLDEAGRAKVLDFRDRAMASVKDIEDLVEMGKDMETCPYYAARTSARQAELVTLPYSLLLQKTARETLGISLKGSIVLVDEAHNLIDTVLAVHTCFINSTQLTVAKGQIEEYLRRFGGRLRGDSEVHLRTLRRLLDGLEKLCSRWAQSKTKTKASTPGAQDEEVWTAARVISELGGNLDTINFAQLERFLKEGQIARKVSGYAEKQAAKAEVANQQETSKKDVALRPSAISSMHSIESFLLSLSNRTQDGRVLLTLLRHVDGRPPAVQLKYQLLNPSEAFQPIVDEARAVILAGGTMEPISDVRLQLVPTLRAHRWSHFSCGHIVPSSNLFCSVVASGPRGMPFDFKFGNRNDVHLLDDLGNALANFAAIVPHGIVVFLPSYRFLDDTVARWKEQGLWKRLEARKRVFTEPKLASEVDATLRQYSDAIDAAASASSTVTGSLLLAVVGAKLSEGINFSDRLARAVVMVGMPFPNSQSAELKERMRHVKETAATHTLSKPGSDAGRELYINLCMKAVNQSIGRAIRHQGDFAALLLLDGRYGKQDIRNRLPAWIRGQTKSDTGAGFGAVVKDLGAFIREKRAKGLL
ncbi:DNA repair helicase [Jaminaea rosea]|uniref:ATP-dependent DNA helicase CHL1 n=1 Tax=Jaminaea rosea TaxID=1569628 RepID=A0A316ULU2_9BASI|nr:DNA repair helicase [Jaminaea rosea]PWN26227.1 DNA repair helicase [Jaminaea rosea]